MGKSVPLKSETPKGAMNSRLKTILPALLCPLLMRAQESVSVFNFLSLPHSAHTTALGGRNISLIEDDASLTFQNPALLASVSDNSMNFNFLSFMQGAKAGSASFCRVAGDRGTWGVNAQFVGYGSLTETLVTGEVLGEVKALDMALSGLYSYSLSDRWVGGAAGKFIYSKYAAYTSVALAVDLGLNYYDEENDFSLSAVAANLGGQVKAFGDSYERVPFNLQVGFTKGVAHSPLRFSLTLTDLTRWSSKYFYHAEKEPSFGRILMNHVTFGLNFLPTSTFYIAAGYNFRRAYEMKAAGGSHGAGLSFGAGLHLRQFKLGVAYAKYHLSAPTLSLSLGYSL